MKILFVSHYYPPAHTAGTETYAYNLATRLKIDHSLMIFHTEKRLSCKDYSLWDESFEGIPKKVLISNRCYRDFGETFSNPRAEQAFEKVLDDFKPDLVHLHHLMFTSFRIPALAKKRGIPVVMTLHDFFLICPRGGRLMLADGSVCPGPGIDRCSQCLSTYKYRQSPGDTRVIRWLGAIRSCTGIDLNPLVYWLRDKVVKRDLSAGTIKPIQGDPAATFPSFLEERQKAVAELRDSISLFMTPSHTVGNALIKEGFPAEKVKHWHYGIDQSPFAGVKPQKRTRPVIAFFGTYMPHKGVHVLVKAAADLPVEKAEVLVRGSAANNPAYLAELKSLAGPGTQFLPGFKRDGIREAFESIDLLVIPSLWLENSPVVIQEAFACGIPVITSDLGGMRELVTDGVDGRLFPPGDEKALAAILQEVAEHPEKIDAWRKGVKPPRCIDEDRQAMEVLYKSLVE